MISIGKLHNSPNENLAQLSVHPRIISLDLSITEKNQLKKGKINGRRMK